jgi:hypothetical protein
VVIISSSAIPMGGPIGQMIPIDPTVSEPKGISDTVFSKLREEGWRRTRKAYDGFTSTTGTELCWCVANQRGHQALALTYLVKDSFPIWYPPMHPTGQSSSLLVLLKFILFFFFLLYLLASA